MPLGHLIALISNAHLRKPVVACAWRRGARFLLLLGTVNTAYRKTSCIEINPNQGLRLASQGCQARTRSIPTTASVGESATVRRHQRGALSALHVTGVSLLHDVKITACLVGSGTDALRCLDLHDPAIRRLTRATAGGARRDRTDDLLLAKQALSQLSYGPIRRRRP